MGPTLVSCPDGLDPCCLLESALVTGNQLPLAVIENHDQDVDVPAGAGIALPKLE